MAKRESDRCGRSRRHSTPTGVWHPECYFPKLRGLDIVGSMLRFLTHWLTTALALGVASWILPGVEVTSLAALAVASVVLGFVNAVVKPILVLLTLPFTVVTLGLFYLVVNGLAFGIAAALVPGFLVHSFWSAIVGAFLVGLVSWFVGGGSRPVTATHAHVRRF